jgi:hypothetical protein
VSAISPAHSAACHIPWTPDNSPFLHAALPSTLRASARCIAIAAVQPPLRVVQRQVRARIICSSAGRPDRIDEAGILRSRAVGNSPARPNTLLTETRGPRCGGVFAFNQPTSQMP